MNKPVSQPCLRNQQPIYEALAQLFRASRSVLEIGSGTGQHAVYMAERMPNLRWQPSELEESLPGIQQWRADSGLGNVLEPVVLDVSWPDWPLVDSYDAVFTANTLHFVGWPVVHALLQGVACALSDGGRFCVYGPFNIDGQYTSEGNVELDQWLKSRDPQSGIKDLADIVEAGASVGLKYVDRRPMPANNMLLEFVRIQC